MNTGNPNGIALPQSLNNGIQNVTSGIQSGVQSVTSSIQSGVQSLGQTVTNAKTNMNDTFSQFSQQSQTGVGASNQFLQSNTIIAKIVFILLVLIGFLVLLALGILFLTYLTSPQSNPYLVHGMIEGNTPMTITQNPSDSGSIFIQKSNNQSKGIEFTWSFWIYVSDLDLTTDYQHVFNKGDTNFTNNGIASINNGPGVYLTTTNTTTGYYNALEDPKMKNKTRTTGPTMPNATGSTCTSNSVLNDKPNLLCQMYIVMDTVVAGDKINSISIDNIPIRKWVHVAIRMENSILDVYINGTIENRLLMDNVPKQNSYNVNICNNGGFSGNLSNLRYFNYALNVFDINSIVSWGPNLTLVNSPMNSNYYYYLSRNWYKYN
jgi:hypothetical protein